MAHFDDTAILVQATRASFEDTKSQVMQIVANMSGIASDQIPYLESGIDMSNPEGQKMNAKIEASDVAVMRVGSTIAVSIKNEEVREKVRSALQANFPVFGNDTITRTQRTGIGQRPAI
jgi:hypothetical protein